MATIIYAEDQIVKSGNAMIGGVFLRLNNANFYNDNRTAKFCFICYNTRMKMEENQNNHQRKKWYQKIWVITGMVLAGIVIIGLVLFAYKTYGFYRDIKSGNLGGADFMPISQPTEEMRMQELLRDRQREQNRAKVRGQEGDPYYGPENAEQEIVVFVDYGCPYCKMAAGTVEDLKRNAEGVKITIRDFPIVELHPQAMSAAKAARCVWRQGDPAKYGQYSNLLYLRQGSHDEQSLKQYAAEVGAETLAFSLCMRQQGVVNQINRSIMDAETAGVTATPTFFIDGIKIEGVHDASKLLKLLD